MSPVNQADSILPSSSGMGNVGANPPAQPTGPVSTPMEMGRTQTDSPAAEPTAAEPVANDPVVGEASGHASAEDTGSTDATPSTGSDGVIDLTERSDQQTSGDGDASRTVEVGSGMTVLLRSADVSLAVGSSSNDDAEPEIDASGDTTMTTASAANDDEAPRDDPMDTTSVPISSLRTLLAQDDEIRRDTTSTRYRN